MANTKRLLDDADITKAVERISIIKRSADIDGQPVKWNVLRLELTNGDDIECKLDPLGKAGLFYLLEFELPTK